jgi:polyhydroxybutyrate depolymerase
MRATVSFFLIICVAFVAKAQEFSITHDGLLRTYRLHLPVNYDQDSIYPLVINMHGLGSNAWEQELYTEFNNVSDTGRFIVAYPNGINETWNVSSEAGTDDVGFISALIDSLDMEYGVDLQRVYATGMSMGGFMSYRLACQLSDRIAAIASVTGLQAFYPCNPGKPVPVVQFHGTLDPIVPYSGVATTINNWVTGNGCPATPVLTELPDLDTNDNSTVTVSYYGLCDDSTEVMLYTIIGGEHTWPGAAIIIGITNQDIHASNEIWKFFKKFDLQGSTEIDEELTHDISCNIFPNPVSDLAVVEINGIIRDAFSFSLFDTGGRNLLELRDIQSLRFPVDFSTIPPGFYIATFSGDGWRAWEKVVVR